MSTTGGWREPGSGEDPKPGTAPGSAPGTAQGPWPGFGWPPPEPRPGVVPLRPLGFGELLGGVLATVRTHTKALYLPVLGAALASYVLVSVSAVLSFLSLSGLYSDASQIRDYQPTPGQIGGLITAITVTTVILLCCAAATYAVGFATSTTVVRYAVLGRPVTARQVWEESRPHLWRVLGAQLLTVLISLGILLVSALPGLLLGLTTDSGIAAGAALLLLIPGWFYAVYVQVRLILLVPVLVMEDQPVVAALRRAWKLNEGAWWRSLSLPYLVNMIGSFATQFVAGPFLFVGAIPLITSTAGQAAPDGQSPTPSAIAFILFGVAAALGLALGATLALPLTPVAYALLYLDRRLRRENLAAALLRAAGVETTPAPRDDTPTAPAT